MPTIADPRKPAEPIAEKTDETETGNNQESDIIYLIKKGDTFSRISQKYGVSTKQLMEWNNMKTTNLRAGAKLIIKKGGKKTQAKKEAVPVQANNNAIPTKKETTKSETRNIAVDGIYTVKSGDNLYNISRRHHCTVKQLMEWNNLKNDKLRLNQKLIIKQ